jgi:hypothetical protein
MVLVLEPSAVMDVGFAVMVLLPADALPGVN